MRLHVVERFGAALGQECVEGLAGTVLGADRGCPYRYRRAQRGPAEDQAECVIQVRDQRAVVAGRRPRQVAARSARPEQDTDDDADPGADGDVLDPHQPDLPSRR